MTNEKRRYKVIEKAGGIGEVVQIIVHDAGVNTGDNLPPLLITSTRGNGSSYASRQSAINQGNSGLITPLMKSSCSTCARYQKQVWKLETKIDYLAHQMYVNNMLNTLLTKLRERDNLVESILTTKECTTREQETTALTDYVERELTREEFLHGLMDVFARPTKAEESAFWEKNTPASLRSLKKEINLSP